MSAQYKESLWIVWNKTTKTFFKHPNGNITLNIDEAHGWHYKREALEHAGMQAVVRRRDARALLGMPAIPKRQKPNQ